jgi:hypothetical protein
MGSSIVKYSDNLSRLLKSEAAQMGTNIPELILTILEAHYEKRE